MSLLNTRVTQRSIADRTMVGLQANQARLAKLQEQLSSGRVVSRPSDNPGGAVSALQLRSEIRRSEQYARNAQDGLGWLGTIDSTMTGMNESIRRVRDLTLQGLNSGSMSTESRAALAAEVETIRDSLIGAANTTYLGRPVFGGTTSGGFAFNPDGTYAGDTNSVVRTVGPTSDVKVDANGESVFATGGLQLFSVLDELATNLRSGDTTALGTNLSQLDQVSTNMMTQLADVGARFKRIEQLQTGADNRAMDLKGTLSTIEDVDLPKVLMEIALQDAAYKAALDATSRTVQPSLMDYLR